MPAGVGQGGTQDVSVQVFTPSPTMTISTALATLAVSGGGGGVQYSVGDTSIGATGTGSLIMAVFGTTIKALTITDTGKLNVESAYSPSGTQDVSVVAFTPGGTQDVAVTNTVTINGTATAIPSGTQTVAGAVTISGTATVIPSGTQDVSMVNAPTMTVSTNLGAVVIAPVPAGTATIGGVFRVPNANNWNANVVQTTAANVIVQTSGAHTLYVTDLLVSVDVPMNITIFSAATAKIGPVYLATKGGFVFPLTTPLPLNSAQSLTLTPSASGSCSCYAAGYTVT